ncbi:DUF1800 domain-containing protein [Massilia terrae]|uniref:DUF1800 domain-containing protein n=1 Tax=Massilia terrae TaxID=1811224 RepID=A0ABT2CYT1_9BURK|nr:DUF1800 domain-containing protein [Massilia terrae]MCS0658340.1 DUF1800 domain-containing protein [Massilia terrae]
MKRTAALIVVSLLCASSPLLAADLATDQQAVHVLNRLGYGPRPGDVERVKQMGVERYIDSQLHPESIPMPQDLEARLKSLETVSWSAGDALRQFNELRKEVRNEDEGAKQKRRLVLGKMNREAADARLLRAIDSPRQLQEVMVEFWFNHFNVFAGKGVDRALITSYERDAIRPFAMGSFRELLGATAHHPAMLYYLDNVVSTSSAYGEQLARRGNKGPRGLNENYARELMELHTLGVDGGYTQKDVTELARMLTGWTYQPQRMVRFNENFSFDPRRHDQGVKTWLGRTVQPSGQREGEMALDVLAVHPATAHHISFQLAQYFVSDNPPPALVDRMAKTWLATNGDIRSVLKTLFTSDEFMAPQTAGAKFKTPYQFVISAVRASGVEVTNVQPLLGAMTQLGMPLYGCQTPDGYKNTQEAWLNPDALTRRITFATALGSGRMALSGPLADQQQRQAMSASAALPARAMADGEMMPPAGAVAPAANPPMVTNTVAANAMAAAAAAQPLDPARLQATLDGSLSPRTLGLVASNPPDLRAAMLLGSPDFMQH